MAKFGFLSVLEEELEKALTCDFAMDWDKKNHAVEVTFLLEAQNTSGVETIDADGETSSEDIFFEDYVLFYNPVKSMFNPDDYLATIPYDPQKGLSREFLAYFAEFLNETATEGLSDLMDFLSDKEVEEFAIKWDTEAFDNGRTDLIETTLYPYPRY
ncbi:DUF3013 family protein [Streptococcus sp. S784/96/1]|uniref:DUF3013 family protein n=1 Tax=Streptococcus sp. S784/96/1 TaxID=2653499 RepID=UPI0013893AE4|nr:DUF3013 family protein [Streptococcus sp. S784/96/1]